MNKVILSFLIFYAILSLITIYLLFFLAPDPLNFAYVYERGIQAGRTALVFYLITLIPGIFRRFRIHHKILAPLAIYRRYIGITSYIFIIMHISFVKVVPIIQGYKLVLPPLFFEIFGFLAALGMFFMFMTSNTRSVRRLGQTWKKIHSFTYIAVGLIFLHTYLQRLSLGSVAAGVFFALVVSSLIYDHFQRRKTLHN